MRRPVSLSKLSRERRNAERKQGRSARGKRGAATKKALATRPSEGLSNGWLLKEPGTWSAQDALAFYAYQYKAQTGREDSELTVSSVRKKSMVQLRRLLDTLDSDECPKEYIEYAIRDCLSGKGYPSDCVPSVTAICYRSIILKKWRLKATNPSSIDASHRGRNWEEG